MSTLSYDVGTDRQVYFTDWSSIPNEYDVFFKVRAGISFKGTVRFSRGFYTLSSFDGVVLLEDTSLTSMSKWIKEYCDD